MTTPDPLVDDAIEWEFIDGTRANGRLERDGDGRAARCLVPADAPPGHAWLRQRASDGTDAWLDIIIVPPWEIQFSAAADYTAEANRPLELHADILNRLPATLHLDLSAQADAGTVAGLPRVVTVPGRQSTVIDLAWAIPWAAGRRDLALDAHAGERRQTVNLALQTRLEPAVLFDLLNPGIQWRKGRKSRDGSGGPGLPTTYDGNAAVEAGASSTGVTRPAFFMHPPWGQCPPGYTYAETTLTLPENLSVLSGWTGLRDGMDASDGVIFSVFVTTTDDDVTTKVFERHHVAVAWEPLAVDLARFGGRTIVLRLQVDCGPADNTSADHALWGQPRLVTDANHLVAVPVAPGS